MGEAVDGAPAIAPPAGGERDAGQRLGARLGEATDSQLLATRLAMVGGRTRDILIELVGLAGDVAGVGAKTKLDVLACRRANLGTATKPGRRHGILVERLRRDGAIRVDGGEPRREAARLD